MEGAGLAANQQTDLALFHAWHAEAFAREKRLKPLGKYLSSNRPKKSQSAAEMLATLQEFADRGAKMKIKRVSN